MALILKLLRVVIHLLRGGLHTTTSTATTTIQQLVPSTIENCNVSGEFVFSLSTEELQYNTVVLPPPISKIVT